MPQSIRNELTNQIAKQGKKNEKKLHCHQRNNKNLFLEQTCQHDTIPKCDNFHTSRKQHLNTITT